MRIAALVLLAVALPTRADDGKALAPFLDERTVAVLRIDLTKLDATKLVDNLAAAGKVSRAEVQAATNEWVARVEGLVKDGARQVYAVTSLADVPDEGPFLVVPLGAGANAAGLTKRLVALNVYDKSLGVSRVGTNLIVASAATFKRLQKLKPVARPEMAEALSKDGPAARLVIAPTTDARRILEETVPALPDEIGGGSVKALSRGFRWLALDADAPALALRLTLQAADADSARELDGLLGRLLKALADSKDVTAAVPAMLRIAALWKPTRDEARLTLRLDEKTTAGLLQPYLGQLVALGRQSRDADQLRRLVAAMHEYHDKHGTFPAHASHDKAGKALLSWRVHLLPFLGEGALYKEFRLEEPWDSEHNKKLLARMPAVYRPQDAALAGRQRTTYLAPRGEDLMFPDKRGVRIAEVTDGTSHTVVLVDVEEKLAVEWTRPDDVKIDEKKIL